MELQKYKNHILFNYPKMEISIIIPAYNEEKNLAGAVDGLYSALKNRRMNGQCEILIFNDYSSDRTGEIADRLARDNPRIRVFHNEKNMGLGYNFKEGVKAAKGKYVTWIPGDNENLPDSFVETLSHVGEADIIIPFTANQEVRPFGRRFISKIYTTANNLLFGLNLKYYNGLSVYRKDFLDKLLSQMTHSFAFSAEILVNLLKSGATYIEVPIKIKPRMSGKSSAFRVKNIFNTIKTILKLFYKINIKRNRLKIK